MWRTQEGKKIHLQYRERKSKVPDLCKAGLAGKPEALLETVSHHGLFSPPSSLRKLSATTSRGAFFWVNQREKRKTGLAGFALSDFFFFFSSLLPLLALAKMTACVMHEITHVID